MSYTDAVRFFYKGDRERAAQHVGTARRLLYELARQIGDAGLSVGRRRLVLPVDGTIIDVRIAGLQAVAIIEVPPVGRPIEGKGDFVVWATDDNYPTGIDGEFPQQMLKPIGKAAKGGWRAYKKSDDIEPGNGGGVYGGTFPDGLKHAGNIDWVGPNKERLSWYGPETRYWYDRFRQPSKVYDKKVFLFGKPLLDIDAYCLEAEIDMDSRLVLGAALNGTSLLVMQANIADEETPSLVPFGRPGDTFYSYAYPESVVQLRLMRYAVTAEASLTGIPDYTVVPGSGEQLWAGNGRWLVNPWFFSPDGTKLDTFAVIEAHIARVYRTDAFPPAVPAWTYTAPSPWNMRFTLTIDGDAVELESEEVAMAVTTAGATAPVACDYDENGNRVDLLLGYEFVEPRITEQVGNPNDLNRRGMRFFFQIGERQIDLYAWRSENDVQTYSWAWPLGVDLRVDAWALARAEWTTQGHINSLRLETHQGASVTSNEPISNEDINGGSPPMALFFDILVWAGATTVSPLFFLLGSATFGYEGDYNPAIPDGHGGTWFAARGAYHSCAIGLSWAQRIPDEVFGASIVYDVDDGNIITGSQLSEFLPEWAYAPEDTDGHLNSNGFAANDEVLLFSGYVGMNNPGAEQDTDYFLDSFITKGDLGVITGIAGPHNRYHPIWIAGKPPDIPPTGDAS